MIIVNWLSVAIGVAGIAIIVWGIVFALVRFVGIEYAKLRGRYVFRRREILRNHLGSYLLLGLESLIAADLIRTIQRPTLEEMAILGSIVIIRTIISYSLNREMEDSQPSQKRNREEEDSS